MFRSGGLAPSAVMQAPPPSVPVSGGTVQSTNTAMMGLTVINPAGTLATLTIGLPPESTSTVGQVERFAFQKAITLLTVSGATTILGAPSAAVIGDNIGFQKVAANTWMRMI